MDWDKIKLGGWSAAGGAVLAMIVGFNWGGWVTGKTLRHCVPGIWRVKPMRRCVRSGKPVWIALTPTPALPTRGRGKTATR